MWQNSAANSARRNFFLRIFGGQIFGGEFGDRRRLGVYLADLSWARTP